VTECVVLITGALTGIGRATAFAFASEGAKLVVSGRHQDKGDELAAELRRNGAEAEFVKANVRHETTWQVSLTRQFPSSVDGTWL
jgi:NADP-dependent 3-hydroxy acid dehydrogenase YdfG